MINIKAAKGKLGRAIDANQLLLSYTKLICIELSIGLAVKILAERSRGPCRTAKLIKKRGSLSLPAYGYYSLSPSVTLLYKTG